MMLSPSFIFHLKHCIETSADTSMVWYGRFCLLKFVRSVV
jgi:hypothetical protein